MRVALIGTGNVGKPALVHLINDFDIASGHIPKGSAAALRFEVRGMVDGNAAVVAAPPGVRTTLDLPLVTGNGLYAGGKSG